MEYDNTPVSFDFIPPSGRRARDSRGKETLVVIPYMKRPKSV